MLPFRVTALVTTVATAVPFRCGGADQRQAGGQYIGELIAPGYPPPHRQAGIADVTV